MQEEHLVTACQREDGLGYRVCVVQWAWTEREREEEYSFTALILAN